MQAIEKLIKSIISLLSLTPEFILGLMARIFVGLQFYKSGSQKFDGWFNISDNTLFLFENEFTGVPLPYVLSAHMAAYSEVIFGALLMLGLFARFSALGLLGVTFVIQFFVYPESYILHGLWAVSLLYVIKHGPGKISLDHLYLTMKK